MIYNSCINMKKMILHPVNKQQDILLRIIGLKSQIQRAILQLSQIQNLEIKLEFNKIGCLNITLMKPFYSLKLRFCVFELVMQHLFLF